MPKTTASPLSERERELVQRLLGDPTELPAIFRSWLIAYIEANPPLLPISQITGFSQFLATAKEDTAAVTTTSTTFVSLSGGPSLDSLADGVYLVFVACDASASSASKRAIMSYSLNGAAAAEENGAASNDSPNEGTHMMASLATLSNGGQNTLEAKYRSSDTGSTARFLNRRIIALKIANP